MHRADSIRAKFSSSPQSKKMTDPCTVSSDHPILPGHAELDRKVKGFVPKPAESADRQKQGSSGASSESRHTQERQKSPPKSPENYDSFGFPQSAQRKKDPDDDGGGHLGAPDPNVPDVEVGAAGKS